MPETSYSFIPPSPLDSSQNVNITSSQKIKNLDGIVTIELVVFYGEVQVLDIKTNLGGVS